MMDLKDIEKIRAHFVQRYHVHERVGEGGMSVVYRACQRQTGRIVAIKILKPELYDDIDIVTRFYKEIRIGATLNHPNLLKIFYGENFNGLHFLEMEFLKGMSLYMLIKKDGRLSQSKTLKMALSILSAISYLHNQGIVHRDIKSPNIYMTKHQGAILMDFGVSYRIEENYKDNAGTEKFLTVEYSSPEDLSGLLTPDKRSDLYSFGVVLYECLTGRLPFRSKTVSSTIREVIESVPPVMNLSFSRTSGILEAIVIKVLQKKPENRFQSAYELWNEIKKIDEPGINSFFEFLFPRKITVNSIQFPYTFQQISNSQTSAPQYLINGKEIDKDKYLSILGRKTPNGAVPDIDIQNTTISRQHCEIIWTKEWIGIRHLYSDNPTFINSEKLKSGEIYAIRPNDILTVGDINLKLLKLD